MDLHAFERRLGVAFKNRDLLKRALTHRSYTNEHPEQELEDNQRLEFLGDAVLDFVTGELLYHRFPKAPEGRLTRLRAALVRTETLADFAISCGVHETLMLGKGEEENGGRERESNLCDAFEAVVGALYLDQGIEVAARFTAPLLEDALEDVLEREDDKDPKSRLQEWSQRHLSTIPTYETIDSTGPDHAKEFTVAVYLNGEEQAQGMGRSKRAAAQEAARKVLNERLDDLLE
jgi:ribonuclease-3